MNRNQKIALAEKDLSVKALGQLLDKHPNHVSAVLSGRFKCAQLRKKIAELLGKSESYLWPEKAN